MLYLYSQTPTNITVTENTTHLLSQYLHRRNAIVLHQPSLFSITTTKMTDRYIKKSKVAKLLSEKVYLTSQQHCCNVVTKLWQSYFLNFIQPPSYVATTLSQSFLTFIKLPSNVVTDLWQSYFLTFIQPPSIAATALS